VNDSRVIDGPVKAVIVGGIGSGKSTVGDRLRDLGAVVIEADLLGHQVLEEGGAAYREVTTRWPSVVVDGVVNRAALAEIVFQDVSQLRELEKMTRPAIATEISRRVEVVSAPVVAIELPIGSDFFGPGWVRIMVQAPEEVRVARAVARGAPEADVRRRVAVQRESSDWGADAHYVVVNDGSLADLYRAVDELWADLVTSGDRRGSPAGMGGED
jgi:dephospho-CoA kinase